MENLTENPSLITAKNGRPLSTFNHWKGKTRYRKHGKILTPLTDEKFRHLMTTGHFENDLHKSFAVLTYYTAVRRLEALRSTGKQYTITEKNLVFEVGKRLKRGATTPPLPLPLDLPFINYLVNAVENAGEDFRVFDFSPKTAYNIFDRLGAYPHFCRLSRITNFFLEGWTIPQVRSWTGLSLAALNFYIGLVDIAKMGDSLRPKQEWRRR
jgi:hypothetical protein